MSTNYTQNYNLCQWEASDKVLREDFNADNAKLEAALTAHKAAIDRAKAVADAAYCPTFLPVVAGSYSGDSSPVRNIVLGFKPKAVMILPSTLQLIDTYSLMYSAGLATDSGSLTHGSVVIVENGFQVYYNTSGNVKTNTNGPGMQYLYLAVR